MNNFFNDYILERLLVNRKIDPITKCWNWTGARHIVWRYGQIHYRPTKKTHHLKAD